MSDPIDPGTPEARRAWLDSLPVGAVVVDAYGERCTKRERVWFGQQSGFQPDDMRMWCGESDFWPARVAPPTLTDTAAAIVEWQASTFGAPGDPLVTLDKMLDEVAELRDELRQVPIPGTEAECEARALEELADVVFLALDLSRGMGGPDALAAAMAAKLERNRERVWAQAPDGKWSGSK